MKGSFRIARVAGIPVEVHWTFGLFLLFLVYLGASGGIPWASIAWVSFLVLSLFFCIILHEFGHALTARHYGVNTKDIIISPIGGVARLDKLPEKPIEEFYVAIAGPLVNMVIVLILLPYFFFYSWEDAMYELRAIRMFDFSGPLQIIPFLLIGNAVLAGFNLLPAFPMDGGRIFRSLMSIKFGRLKATRIATYLGNFFGILMVILGLFWGNFITALIGVFIYLLASQEYKMVKMDELLARYSVGDILRYNFTLINTTDPMNKAFEELKRGTEKNFLVFDENKNVAGVLHEAFLLEALKNKEFETPAEEYMSPRFESVKPERSLKSLFHIMQQKGYSIVPVIEDEILKGVVDVEGLSHFMKLQQKVS